MSEIDGIRWNLNHGSMWIPDGNSIWNDGFHDIPYGFQVEWIHQNGWDTSQNIFHMEWVESIWNVMDSTWIPCGIWGESKDLDNVNLLHAGLHLGNDIAHILDKLELDCMCLHRIFW